MPKGTAANLRRKAREVAVQALYEVDVAGHPVEGSLQWLNKEVGLSAESSEYASELLDGVVGHKDEIDKFIHKYAPAWPVKQLPVVDRNILRLALFEIRFGRGIPRKVAINEAVELAKIFGSDSSARFVNGVLGSVMDEFDGTDVGDRDAQLATEVNNSQEWK